MLLPIIMIVVCVLLGGGTLLFLKFSEKRKKAKGRDKEELAQMTANEFVNVKDIRGSFLYTGQSVQRAISVSAFGGFTPGGHFSPDGGVVLYPHFFIGYKAEGIAEA